MGGLTYRCRQLVSFEAKIPPECERCGVSGLRICWTTMRDQVVDVSDSAGPLNLR